MLKVLDLFSGIGGFSLGLERTGGFKTVAFCENNAARWPLYEKHWPGVPIIEDVKRLPDGLMVDLVAAGFPCQDISLVGSGAGLAGYRSRLFWRIIRAVRLVGRPRLLLENVAELLDRGMGTVLGALASIGYDAQWNCIPACAVGAPHIRDRVWIIANCSSVRATRLLTSEDISAARQRWEGGSENLLNVARTPFERGNCYPQPLLRRMDDGFSPRVDRNNRTEGCGNAIIPSIAELHGYAILEGRKNDGKTRS